MCKIKIWSIYSLSPAPWGDNYRFVESFDTQEDAEKVVKCLESVNVLMNCYRLVEEERYAIH
jgi:hypothetical protein